MARTTFHLPTRPSTLAQAINRYGAATGSYQHAVLAGGADYNGHTVAFCEPNDCKPYWTCYFIWDGIKTIGRGTLESCLRAAKAEYDRGAAGASAEVRVETEEDAATCRAAGWVEGVEVPAAGDDRIAMIPEAFRLERHGTCPGAVGMLMRATSGASWEKAVDAHFAEVKARRDAQRRAEEEAEAAAEYEEQLTAAGWLK